MHVRFLHTALTLATVINFKGACLDLANPLFTCISIFLTLTSRYILDFKLSLAEAILMSLNQDDHF